MSFLREKIKILLNDNNNYLKYDNINYFFESDNNKNLKLHDKLNVNKINQRLNSNNNFYTINNNTIYGPELDLYNNDKNVENLNQIDFYINKLLNNNFDKCKYNYYNIVHLINGYEANENIEKNKNNSLELKDNIKDLKIKKKSKKIKISNNKKKNIFKIIRKVSKYRGVSKNRKKWQVYISIKGKNTYLGTYASEKIAAKIYDFMAIKKKGNKAKTNFEYNIRQIMEISKININIANIFDIVSKIFI